MFVKVMFSSLKRGFSAWVLVVILFSGCATTNNPKAGAGVVRENVHPNGLIVELSDDFSARQTANGFVVEPSGEANRNLRVPSAIIIDLIKDKNIESATIRHEKLVGNRRIKYEIEKNGGGSNGEIYDFTGYEQISGGVIQYRQITQSKTSEPDFSNLWKMIENTTLKK